MQRFKKVVENYHSVAVLALYSMMGCTVMLLGFCHAAACIWYYLGRTGWVLHTGISNEPIALRYFKSLSFVMSQLQGSTDMLPGQSLVERAYHALMVFASIVFLG